MQRSLKKFSLSVLFALVFFVWNGRTSAAQATTSSNTKQTQSTDSANAATDDSASDTDDPDAQRRKATDAAIESSQSSGQATSAAPDSGDAGMSNEDAPADDQPSYGVNRSFPYGSDAGSQSAPVASGSKAGTQTTASQAQRRTAAQQVPQAPRDEDASEPQYVRTPYPGVESLRDLYRKVASSTAPLRRFGSDVFRYGTGNTNLLPSDLPVGPDYVLGAGDQVVLNLWGGRTARLTVPVDRQGQVVVPEAGPVVVDGLTIGEAQTKIQAALSQQFRDEHVEISLGRVRTIRVYVVGDAQRPGGYDVSSLATPLTVLYAAGGPTSRGSLRVLRQMRGTQLVRDIDLYDFLLAGKQPSGERLQSGDTIVVPPVGPQVTIRGMVRRPAIYEMKGDESLNQMLDIAGGVLVTGSLRQLQVERVVANEHRTMVNVTLPTDPSQRTAALKGFQLQGDDSVTVSQILPYNEQAVYLEGHVFRPGKYPFKEGMTVGDLIRSYQDVLPEPADHAEIVRLMPPDYEPQTISLNLPDVLVGNDVVRLQPLDLVRIYGRYEADAPRVKIQGEVLRPGTYPLAKGMSVASLINLAGGFRRSAYRHEVGLSSYGVVDGKQVLLSQKTLALPDDMSQPSLIKDSQALTSLQPGDVLSVRQLAGWKDIGSSVELSGEIEHTGSYGIEAGEHLSSVLKRAGGFRPGAYPAAAVLTRADVKVIQLKDRESLVTQLESMPASAGPSVDAANADAVQKSIESQRQQALSVLRSNPPTGRQVIAISTDIKSWEGTPADVEMRAGDVLTVPKMPQFVVVSGQTYNPDAITFVPGKTAAWYLARAGGVTQFGNKKHIFVVRADGSVVSHGNNFRGALNIRMRPGDSVVVPVKIQGYSEFWKQVIAAGELAASLALTAAIAAR